MRRLVTELKASARGADNNAYATPPGALLERPTWVAGPAGPPPLYWRLLRLHNVRPAGWQRALLVEGVLAVAVTLVLADVASAWTLIVLPLAVAVVVKAHDVLAGMLPGRRVQPALPPPALGDYAPVAVTVLFIVVVRLVLGGSTSDLAEELALYTINALLCLAIYRYLVRRNTTRETAILIAATGFFLSVVAAALGAALEVRRHPTDTQSGRS